MTNNDTPTVEQQWERLNAHPDLKKFLGIHTIEEYKQRRMETYTHFGVVRIDDHNDVLEKLKIAKEALELAKIRFEICSDRMQACYEETGNHELRDEVIMFAEEIAVTLSELTI